MINFLKKIKIMTTDIKKTTFNEILVNVIKKKVWLHK